jgi:hypothetical protein
MGGDEFLSDAFIYGRAVSTRVILLALHPKLCLFHLRIVATRQNGDRNQDYRDDPDAAKAVVDDGANHGGDLAGREAVRQSPEMAITTATADPEYTFMSLESAASMGLASELDGKLQEILTET